MISNTWGKYMILARIFILAILLCNCSSAAAHGLRHTVTEGRSVVIELSYANGVKFADKTYEIYRADGGTLYQTGRTDPSGRIAFIPGGGGLWRIKAFSEDGHGLDITIDANAPASHADTAGAPADTSVEHIAMGKAPTGRWTRIIMILALIFGVFGTVNLFMRKKK